MEPSIGCLELSTVLSEGWYWGTTEDPVCATDSLVVDATAEGDRLLLVCLDDWAIPLDTCWLRSVCSWAKLGNITKPGWNPIGS